MIAARRRRRFLSGVAKRDNFPRVVRFCHRNVSGLGLDSGALSVTLGLRKNFICNREEEVMSSLRPREQAAEPRDLAWTAAKLAVRSYARDPSSQNAGEVQRAWARVRRVTAESARLRMQRPPRDDAA